jgi:hypothetical protein
MPTTLYHYTQPVRVLLIARDGLRPFASKQHGFMTDGIPVVWLTEESYIIRTATDIIRETNGAAPVMSNEAARLTVHLERRDKRLMRYGDFLRKQNHSVLVEDDLCLAYKRDAAEGPEGTTAASFPSWVLDRWWVYLGDIPPRKIDSAVPAAKMLEGLDEMIATLSVAEKFQAACEEFEAKREQVASLPPDELVDAKKCLPRAA